MRGLGHFLLNDDIIDRVIRFSQDFAMLRSVVLSCKAVYDVYRVHPKSINRAVAYNLVGPVLPQALLLARRQIQETTGTTTFDVLPINTDTVITFGEMNLLEANEDVVRQLEDMFSLRHKDRSSAISVLSDAESLRFHRAMYNFWLFQVAFPLQDEPFDPPDDFDINPFAVENENRRQYLGKISSQELHEVNSISIFLGELYTWTVISEGIRTHSYEPGLSLGPKFILENYKNCQFRFNDDIESVNGYISSPVEQIFKEWNVEVAPHPFLKIILDSVNGEHDKCCRCEVEASGLGLGPELWVESNWHLLKGILSPYTILFFFGPRLSRNQYDTPVLYNILRQESTDKLMNEIHEVRTEPYLDWDKQDLLCLGCLSTIIEKHIRLWAVQRLPQDGRPDREDCWYGHKCRTQTHKPEHAQKLNHFCEPTRGDD